MITWPDGTEWHYSSQWGSYFLQKEILPNGKAIYYESNKGLLRIRSSDPTGKYTYASITEIAPNKYVGSDGRNVDYVHETTEITGKSKKNGYLVALLHKYSLRFVPLLSYCLRQHERTVRKKGAAEAAAPFATSMFVLR